MYVSSIPPTSNSHSNVHASRQQLTSFILRHNPIMRSAAAYKSTATINKIKYKKESEKTVNDIKAAQLTFNSEEKSSFCTYFLSQTSKTLVVHQINRSKRPSTHLRSKIMNHDTSLYKCSLQTICQHVKLLNSGCLKSLPPTVLIDLFEMVRPPFFAWWNLCNSLFFLSTDGRIRIMGLSFDGATRLGLSRSDLAFWVEQAAEYHQVSVCE